MYGFHQWAPLNLWILFRFDQQVKGVEGYRQETREGDKSKIGIFILYPFSSLPSGSACTLFFKKGHTSFQLVLSTQISSGSSMVSSLSSSDNGAPLLLALGTWSTLYVFLLPCTHLLNSPQTSLFHGNSSGPFCKSQICLIEASVMLYFFKALTIELNG